MHARNGEEINDYFLSRLGALLFKVVFASEQRERGDPENDQLRMFSGLLRHTKRSSQRRRLYDPTTRNNKKGSKKWLILK